MIRLKQGTAEVGGDYFLLYYLVLYIALKVIKGRRLLHLCEGM